MSKYFAVGLLATCAIAFVLGVAWLFELRFAAGDIYPPYSSLRSDPLGAMALYESLEQMPGFSVQRDYRESNELPYEAGTVYLHLGGQADDWEEMPGDLYRELSGFLGRGGRLVIAFNPESQAPRRPLPSPKDDSKTPDPKKPAPAKPVSTDKKKAATSNSEDDDVSIKDKWGVTFGFVALPAAGDVLASTPVKNVSTLPLPAMLDWHSGMVFSNVDKAWTTVYSRGPDAVVISRQFGPGSVVMISDSYFFSNEALRSDRHADFLAWLVGSGKQIVFDEAHFGIVESPGVMALVRQYHLIGLVAGLVFLALLFIWKNLTSLVPPLTGELPAGFVAGKDSTAGFVNLLRRNISSKDLLGTCIAEWKKSAAGTRPSAKMVEVQLVFEAENALPSGQRNPVEAYRRISAILKQPTFKPAAPASQPPTL